MSLRGRRIALFVAPIVVVTAVRPWCARAAGDHVASRLGRWLAVSSAAAPRVPAPVPSMPLDEGGAVDDARELERGDGVRAPRARASVPWRARGDRDSETLRAGDAGAADKPRVKSVFVPGRAVLAVVRRKSVSATAVNDESGAPLGVALHGVGGTGLVDGDVVTHVAGTRVTSQEQAVGVIVSALANHAKSVSGVVLRNGQPIAVTVEVPKEAQVNAMPPRP